MRTILTFAAVLSNITAAVTTLSSEARMLEILLLDATATATVAFIW